MRYTKCSIPLHGVLDANTKTRMTNSGSKREVQEAVEVRNRGLREDLDRGTLLKSTCRAAAVQHPRLLWELRGWKRLKPNKLVLSMTSLLTAWTAGCGDHDARPTCDLGTVLKRLVAHPGRRHFKENGTATSWD